MNGVLTAYHNIIAIAEPLAAAAVGAIVTGKLQGRRQGRRLKVRERALTWLNEDKRLRSKATEMEPPSAEHRKEWAEHEREGSSVAAEVEVHFDRELANKFMDYTTKPSEELAEEIRRELERAPKNWHRKNRGPWAGTLGPGLTLAVLAVIVVLGILAATGVLAAILLGHPTASASVVRQPHRTDNVSRIDLPTTQPAFVIKQAHHSHKSLVRRETLTVSAEGKPLPHGNGAHSGTLSPVLQQTIRKITDLPSTIIGAVGQILTRPLTSLIGSSPTRTQPSGTAGPVSQIVSGPLALLSGLTNALEPITTRVGEATP